MDRNEIFGQQFFAQPPGNRQPVPAPDSQRQTPHNAMPSGEGKTYPKFALTRWLPRASQPAPEPPRGFAQEPPSLASSAAFLLRGQGRLAQAQERGVCSKPLAGDSHLRLRARSHFSLLALLYQAPWRLARWSSTRTRKSEKEVLSSLRSGQQRTTRPATASDSRFRRALLHLGRCATCCCSWAQRRRASFFTTAESSPANRSRRLCSHHVSACLPASCALSEEAGPCTRDTLPTWVVRDSASYVPMPRNVAYGCFFPAPFPLRNAFFHRHPGRANREHGQPGLQRDV